MDHDKDHQVESVDVMMALGSWLIWRALTCTCGERLDGDEDRCQRCRADNRTNLKDLIEST